jgi:DNA-directed RNA polymerase subunit RPC12/RpoP
MKLILLKTFENVIDANLFASKLESENIQTYLENDNTINLDPLLSNALGGVRVKVSESDYLVAHKIMQEYSQGPIINDSGEEIVCPICSSKNIENGIKDFNGFKGIVTFLIALAFFVIPLSGQTKYRCKDCANLFKSKMTK